MGRMSRSRTFYEVRYDARHPKDINFGDATVPYNENSQCWMALGSVRMYSERQAWGYVREINKIMNPVVGE